MTTDLAGDRERTVRSFVQDGRYASANEVIGQALQLLIERDQATRLDQLRRDLAVSIAQADRGELAPFDPTATLAGVRARRAPRTERSRWRSRAFSNRPRADAQ